MGAFFNNNEEEYGKVSWLGTKYQLSWLDQPTFAIFPGQGELTAAPESRDYRIRLVNAPEQKVTVTVNGVLTQADCCWSNHELVVQLNEVKNTDLIQITLENNLVEEQDKLKRLYNFINKTQIEFNLKLELFNMLSTETSFSKVVRNLEGRHLDNHVTGK